MNNRTENTVSEKLYHFELVEDILPTEQWKESLIVKLKASKPNSRSGFFNMGVSLSLFVIIILNVFLALQLLTYQHEPLKRIESFKIISNEILAVNPAPEK